jgi:hypothetical protein
MSTKEIQEELALLRSFAVSVAGKDREGAYRPALVRRVRAALREKPTKRFTDANTFLNELRKAV